MRALLAQNRLVTLCGTRRCRQTIWQSDHLVHPELRDGLCFVDLARSLNRDRRSYTARAPVGIARSARPFNMDSLRRFIGNRHMLIGVGQLWEHLPMRAALVVELLGPVRLAVLRKLAGRRDGEITWRTVVSITDGSRVFADRASRVQPGVHHRQSQRRGRRRRSAGGWAAPPLQSVCMPHGCRW